MEPKSFGRRMGIGVRVASRMLRERAQTAGAGAHAGSAAANKAGGDRSEAARANLPGGQARRVVPNVLEPARRVGRGTRRFGEAVWGPLVHTGATLWLEITGMFFALFALFFAQNVWKLRFAYRAGAEREHLLLYIGLSTAFLYFSVSSFVRARRRGKRGAR